MTVMVLFGGVTTEHEVSLVTAAQAMAAMQGVRLVPVLIGKDGVWRSDRRMTSIEGIRRYRGRRVWLRPSSPYLYGGGKKRRIDAILSCMHGLNGEDGSVAVWAQTAGIPYTCSALAPSAVGMDKILTKAFLRGIGIPVADGVAVRREEDAAAAAERAGLKYPLVVKPARLGSSIGIAMAHTQEELATAAEVAFAYDDRILIEEGISGRKEYNCAVIGDGRNATAGEIEEVGGMDEVLSFADKYLRDGKVKGMDNAARRIPARIGTKLRKEIVAHAVKIFDALDMRGVVRIDYLYDTETKTLYVNEINVVPGSLAYYLFPDLGMEGVVHKLLTDAEKAFDRECARITDYRLQIGHGK